MSKTVVPVAGRFLHDVPHVEHECDDPFCVKSGAFVEKNAPPPKADAKHTKSPVTPGSSDSKES